jgi:hypothetical protein
MICARIGGGELASSGMIRFRNDGFSSSGMGFAAECSSCGDQPFVIRFLR